MRGAGTQVLVAFLVAFLAGNPVRAATAPAALLPSPSFYAKKGGTRVLVLVAPLDARAKSQQGVIEQWAETAIDASDRFEAMRGIDAFDPTAARARYDKAQEANRLVAEAWKALEDLDSAKATSQFAEAVKAWRQADLTRGIDGLVEAQSGKAAGHSVSEENPQAKADLEKALVLAPKAKFSDAHFPPELLKYAEAQRKNIAKAKGKLTVRTEPPGARVWVDGTYRGASPVTVENLAAGQHIVVAGLSGQALLFNELPPGDHLLKLKGAELGYPLQSALDRIVNDPDGPQRDAAARELGDATRADQVLLLLVKKAATGDGLEATGVRLDPKDGHNYAYGKGTFSADFVTSLLSIDDPRVDKKPTVHVAGGSNAGGAGIGGKRAVGIALLVGAAVAGASWAVFGFSALGRASLYKQLFQVEAMKSNLAASQGRTFALIADISWAVGAAFLLVGVLLAFTPLGRASSSKEGSKPKPPPEDPLEEYRRHQEEQKRLEEERANKPPEEKPTAPEEKKPDEPKPDEKKPDEKETKKTPAEEKAEKKRKAEEEKAEKKRKAEEEKQKKAEEKKKAEEEKKRLADEKKKAAEDEKQKKADEQKKTEEDKKKTADEKKKAAEEEKQKKADEQKKTEEDKKKAAEDEKQKKADEEKKKTDDDQKAKDDAEAKRLDEERKNKEAEELKRRDKEMQEQDRKEQEKKNQEQKPKVDEDDLRNF